MTIRLFFDDSGWPCGAVAKGRVDAEEFCAAANAEVFATAKQEECGHELFRPEEVHWGYRRWEWWGSGEGKLQWSNPAVKGERGVFLATVIERF